MNESNNQLGSEKWQRALRKLNENLEDFDSGSSEDFIGQMDMLSLVIDEASRGVDISVRYPTFYRKLLQNKELRQAFVDALESPESMNDAALVMAGVQVRLDRLKDQAQQQRTIETSPQGSWRVTWERTIAQIQAIFSPSEVIYRADTDLFEDPWFILLRDEIKVGNIDYSVLLEGTLSQNSNEALAISLNVVMSATAVKSDGQFSLLQALLRWGEYEAIVQVASEERVNFPDVPFIAVIDSNLRNVQAPISLTIESLSK